MKVGRHFAGESVSAHIPISCKYFCFLGLCSRLSVVYALVVKADLIRFNCGRCTLAFINLFFLCRC